MLAFWKSILFTISFTIATTCALSDDTETAQLVDSVTQYGYLVYRALVGAAFLAFTFFSYLFFGIYKIVYYILWPVVWVILACWNNFVMKPFTLCIHVAHIFYPVAMFCLAAVLCGLVIGGCAGFAAEAFSSLLITATWGTEKKQNLAWPEDTDTTRTTKEGSVTSETMESEYVPDDEEFPTMSKRLSRDSGESSSYWDASFFGANKKEKGKQAMKAQRGTTAAVESWRHSLSRRSSSSNSFPEGLQSMPTLRGDNSLRRRATYEKQDDWNWVEDDGNDEFTSSGNGR